MSVGVMFILLLGVLLGGLLSIGSGALFAYIVFRTKREAHERLFQPTHKESGIVETDDLALPYGGRPPDTGIDLPGNENAFYTSVDPLTLGRTSEFLRQQTEKGVSGGS